MKIPSHYKLVEEGPHHYEIHDGRDGKNFKIAKQALNLDMHASLSKIPRFSNGGDVKKQDDFDYMVSSLAGDDKARQENYELEQLSMPRTVEEAEAVEKANESQQVEPETPSAPKTETKPEVTEQEPVTTEQPVKTEPTQAAPSKETNYLKRAKETINRGAEAQGKAGKQTAEAYERATEQIEGTMTPMQAYAETKARSDELFDKLSTNEINPNRVIEKMSTGQKIFTAIGLLFGSGRAVDDLNKEIDRDIKAQMANRSNMKDLFHMNLQASQNEQKAIADTKAQYLQVAKAKAIQYANQYAGDVAKAKVAKSIMEIDQEIERQNWKSAYMQLAQSQKIINADPMQALRLIKDPQLAQKAAKEVEDSINVKSLATSMLKDMDMMAQKGPVWMAKNYKNVNSAIKAYTGRLAKLMENSFTENQAEAFQEAFYKDMLEGENTTEERRRRLIELIQSSKTGAYFQLGTGIPLEKFESTSLDNFPKSPGQIAKEADEAKKISYKNYYLKHKNSKDPVKKQTADAIKAEYGF